MKARVCSQWIVAFLLFAGSARAESRALLSFEEFKTIAAELAPKVDLFAEIWQNDPEAELYGGSSRDFLYWLRRKLLLGTQTRTELDGRLAALRREPRIDVREFIIGESDVDILYQRHPVVRADKYGLRKIDAIASDRLDPKTPMGDTERRQGHIALEKIRLSRRGIVTWNEFGDGARELFEGRITVRFAPPDEFKKTHYALIGQNHPVLLAFRYLRIAAAHYFALYGSGVPNREKLYA